MIKTSRSKMLKTTILTGSCALALLPICASAQEEAVAGFTDAQKVEIGAIIKDYLMENPKVIFDAVEIHQQREEEQQAARAQAAIQSKYEKLIAPEAPSVGASAAEADVTIVEFFDYNCGYCKRALPAVQEIVKSDPKVRFVFKEMPILGETSKTASAWALAAAKQDKYFAYHVALMEFRGPKEPEQLAKIAEDLGLDVEKMKEDVESPEVHAEILADVELAREIGISGTPAFIFGQELVPGYIDKDSMQAKIAQYREAMKAQQ